MIRHARDFHRGARVDTFPAADYAEMLDTIKWAMSIKVTPPLEMPAPGVFDMRIPTGFYALLSGSSSPYSWTEQQGLSGGVWQARVLAGMTNAYEVNGVGSLNGKWVWLEPGYPGDYRFQYIATGSGSGPPFITLTGCACTMVPGTLYMTGNGPCSGVFNDCTLVYGPTPSEFSRLNLGANCYLSTETFLDPDTGCSYRYHFACDTIFFRISRVFIDCGGASFEDSFIYAWSIGSPGNACSPFLLTVGTIFQGGPVGCQLTVSGSP